MGADALHASIEGFDPLPDHCYLGHYIVLFFCRIDILILAIASILSMPVKKGQKRKTQYPLKKWKLEDLPDAVSSSINLSQVCRKLGLSHISSNFRTVRHYITELNLNTSHFNKSAETEALKKAVSKKRLTHDQIFCENSSASGTTLRREFKKLVDYKCVICDNSGIHLGNSLRLELDHINGNNRDNRLENLRLLCPNCHSQTETFGYRS